MDISERKKTILRAIIDDYIETAEPVGSKSIAQDAGLGLSSATIRNEMSELEAMGFLEKPHTSAGRIPSPQGYRIYVNELMRRHKLSLEETEEINRGLRQRMQQLDRIITDAGRLTSRLTNYPAYALATVAQQVTISRFDLICVEPNTFIIVVMLSNHSVKNKLVHIPGSIDQDMLIKLSTVFNASFTGITDDKITPKLIDAIERATRDTVGLVAVIASFAIEVLGEMKNSEAYLTGASQFLQYPEFRDVSKAHRILDYLSDESELLKLPTPEEESDLKITIGPENLADELKDSSLVVARYNAGDSMQGLIGVVGPTRMNYSRVAARLSYIARGLGWLLSGRDIPPPKLGGSDKEH
ncbi:MAG: heat-inducible transcriptional repressor HrcA [Oscillospiraceae bacterium]